VDLGEPGHVRRLEQAWRTMVLIRGFEERSMDLLDDGKVWGAIHPSIGQEAVPVGVSDALAPLDRVVSNHRGHGHILARGADLLGAFAELMGRRTGLCGGRGGSMHLADIAAGIVGTNGIVGGGASVAVGSAFASRYRGDDHVTVVYLGDGAMSQGIVHESILLSRLWMLPILWVCENNGYAVGSPLSERLPGDRVGDVLTRAINSYRCVDGNDYEAVWQAAIELLGPVRAGNGPGFLECLTYRLSYHSLKFRHESRPEVELADALAREPIGALRRRLTEFGVTDVTLDAVELGVAQELDAAIERAAAEPEVTAQDALIGTWALGDETVAAMAEGWREDVEWR
jgi:TPP-dependent pyruvate/acetoin dehydrogenase alpha subunit